MFYFDAPSDYENFYRLVMRYLSRVGLVGFPEDGEQASWVDKISVVLFSFWFLTKYSLEPGSSEVGEYLGEKGIGSFGGIFKTISDYVKDRLSVADKDDNGQNENDSFLVL